MTRPARCNQCGHPDLRPLVEAYRAALRNTNVGLQYKGVVRRQMIAARRRAVDEARTTLFAALDAPPEGE